MLSPAGLRHYVILQAIVVLWGLTAVLGKLISLEPAVLVAWRTGIAAGVLGLFLALRGTSLRRGRAVWQMTGTGCLIGLHWFLFFLGGRLGSVSVSLAGVATASLWVALLEPLLIRGRRWSWMELAFAAGVTAGILVIQFDDRGLLTGVCAALVAAVFSIINSRLVLTQPPLVITFYEMCGACLVCIVGALLLGGTSAAWLPAAADWPWLLILSIVCTVFAYSICVWLQQRLSAFSVGLAGNMEPVYGIVLATLVFGAAESQPPRFYVGSLIIFGCVLVHTVLTTRRARAAHGVLADSSGEAAALSPAPPAPAPPSASPPPPAG